MSPAAHTTTKTNKDKGPKALKNAVRHGPTGVVRLAFEGHITKFDNLPADEEQPGGPAF